MSLFGVILVRILPHSDWIQRDTECKNPNKNSLWLFVLPHLNVVFIYQYHYMPKKKTYWAKKQRFDDVTFAMTFFWSKNKKKNKLAECEKNPKP